jgi:acetylornithine deacetylase/succinyl-diaminopimelate desuccinylase-like protein
MTSVATIQALERFADTLGRLETCWRKRMRQVGVELQPVFPHRKEIPDANNESEGSAHAAGFLELSSGAIATAGLLPDVIVAGRSWLALLGLTAVLGLPASSTHAATPPDYRPLAHEMLQELIEIKSSDSGVGSTPAAEAIARRMRAAGFPEADIQVIGPSERKKNVVVRLHGRGQAKPILIFGHLDVVEAEKGDWSPDLDPFKLTERDGYFYGRGTQDMKGAATIAAVNFIRWKQQGWVPSRDLILALTGDEELYGDEDGIDWLLKHHRKFIDAEYSLNSDAGDFLTRNGKPYTVALSAGEKKEVILQLITRNRGGHGSRPREDNAIYELNAAVDRVAKLKFPVVLNDVTRAQFIAMSKLESGQAAVDMQAAAQNPPDPAAVDRLSKDPFYNALLRTTCVATMLKGRTWSECPAATRRSDDQLPYRTGTDFRLADEYPA